MNLFLSGESWFPLSGLSPSLLLFFFLSFHLHQSIQSKRTSRPSHLLYVFPPLQGASPIWHEDLIPVNPQLEGSLTIRLYKGTCKHNWDPDFCTTFRLWEIVCTTLLVESLLSCSVVVLMSSSLLQQQLWAKAPGCTMNGLRSTHTDTNTDSHSQRNPHLTIESNCALKAFIHE